MTLSIRLEPEAKAALEEIARRRGTTQSHLVRSAIEELIGREVGTLYERVEDLIGCAEGGPSDLSEHTGRRFREVLETKAR
jgi:predicted DNA-binding protein